MMGVMLFMILLNVYSSLYGLIRRMELKFEVKIVLPL